jgi:hypothetical protein
MEDDSLRRCYLSNACWPQSTTISVIGTGGLREVVKRLSKEVYRSGRMERWFFEMKEGRGKLRCCD